MTTMEWHGWKPDCDGGMISPLSHLVTEPPIVTRECGCQMSGQRCVRHCAESVRLYDEAIGLDESDTHDDECLKAWDLYNAHHTDG